MTGSSAASPEELLAVTRAIEAAHGRRRDGPPLAPRTLDIDLLFAGRERRATLELELPHPRLAERRFVLEPLVELLGDQPIPLLDRSPRELLRELSDRPWVRRLKPLQSSGRFPC